MAAPQEKNIHNLDGIWVLNKSLSGDLNTLLQLQGVSWLVRRALTGINSSMLMSQSTSNKTTKITITNIASSVIKGTTENMILDGQFHDHKDYIWGAVRSKTRFVHTRDIRNNGDDEFFGQWSQDMQEGDCILTESEAMDGSWTSTMVWVFRMLNGARHFARHVTVQNASKSFSATLVYDYAGNPVQEYWLMKQGILSNSFVSGSCSLEKNIQHGEKNREKYLEAGRKEKIL